MSDMSNVVMPMSYSVNNALDNISTDSMISDSTGWKSSSDNSENTIVIQFNLDSSHSFNRLSFELLDVPQKFAVFYKDKKRNKFVKIKSYKGFVDGLVSGSKTGLEAQNLWQPFQFAFPFINTDLLEIRINRLNDAVTSLNLPRSTRYPVGIRNMQIRFHRVNSDISTINEDEAYKVSYFSPNSVLTDDDSYWKSPPLGPNSIYPFYIDLRTDSGQAQVIENMKLIPLFTDSHVNLYYSNDDTFGPFGLSNNIKTFNLIGSTPSVESNWVKNKGILIQPPNYWQLSNKDIKIDLQSSFAIGFTYEPIDFNNTDINHDFWSFTNSEETQTLSFSFNPGSSATEYIQGTLSVKLNNVDQISLADVQLYKDTAYGIVVGYDSNQFEWTLCVCPMDKGIESEEALIKNETLAFGGFYPKLFSFNKGSSADTISLGYVRNIWIRQDIIQFNYINSFLKNTDTFIRGLGDLNQRNNGYYNAVLAAQLTENLEARVGPNTIYYDGKTWVPANRNLVLNSSIYNLGRLNAKYLKLEFVKPTAQYYNPATSEDVVLPILDFPDWVKEWFLIHQFDSTTNRNNNNSLLFEGSRRLNNPQSSFGLNSLKSAIESSNNNLIFNYDQIGYDFFTSEATDEESIRNQITRNAMTLQFPTASRHNYKTYDYVMASKRAFFYGITELSFFNQDQTLIKDNRVYFGDFLDNDINKINWIDQDNTDNFLIEGGLAFASAATDVITSKSLESFSNFSGLQIAYLDSPLKDLWFQVENETIETLPPSEQINLINISHILPKGSAITSVVDNLKGTTDGKTLLLERTDDGLYGLETLTVDVSDFPNSKFVAGCRVRSNTRTPSSYYEFRLLSLIDSDWKVVAKKQIKLHSNYEWNEIDLIYSSNEDDVEFKIEIMHLDSFSDEKLYVDMLGLWVARNYWEVSNDDGASWVPVIYNSNNALGMVSFQNSGNKLKLRITSKEASSWISKWLIIPVYDSAPVGMSTPQLFKTSNSDDPEYQNIIDQKLFLPYSTQIPRNYSIMTDVVNSKNRI